MIAEVFIHFYPPLPLQEPMFGFICTDLNSKGCGEGEEAEELESFGEQG